MGQKAMPLGCTESCACSSANSQLHLLEGDRKSSRPVQSRLASIWHWGKAIAHHFQMLQQKSKRECGCGKNAVRHVSGCSLSWNIQGVPRIAGVPPKLSPTVSALLGKVDDSIHSRICPLCLVPIEPGGKLTASTLWCEHEPSFNGPHGPAEMHQFTCQRCVFPDLCWHRAVWRVPAF